MRLQHRHRPDAPIEDIWRLLGTTSVPHERRALWEANDLRLGEGAQVAADRLNSLVAETADRTAHVSEITVSENVDFLISVGGERDSLDLLWTDGSGRVLGRHFDKASGAFRCVCRADPEDARAVRLALVPEVTYGPEEVRWVRTPAGAIQRTGRASFVVADLAAEVQLAPGRLLVIGSRTPDAGPGISLGAALFYDRRGPDVWDQTIVLTAERLEPGQQPPSGPVPFLPPAPPVPKAKAPPAATSPAPAPPGQAPTRPAAQAAPVSRATRSR